MTETATVTGAVELAPEELIKQAHKQVGLSFRRVNKKCELSDFMPNTLAKTILKIRKLKSYGKIKTYNLQTY